ncbi:tetraacyldisaccharide 4'-kinase [Lonepinella sp. BR2271]|uniref:tetraacyldisaccharide 4'-kinase n=1 Tax=Lonepinella sp. BR2271 TaxID=3434550 RepID=UPI003F6DE72F
MNFWYTHSKIAYLLLPLAWLFGLISGLRRFLFRAKILKSYRSPVPVIIVGNLSVGGNGKTPVTIWLVEQLQERGIKCGVISRGYGSQSDHYPRLVSADDDPIQSGDEPLLIAKRTGAPVCISPNRQQAIELLLEKHPCEVIISDDGLQHYKLQRDIEIVVMEAERGLGNGLLLPAGPLRETASRLKDVDIVITNGAENGYSNAVMTLVPHYAVNLVTGEKRLLSEIKQAQAMAGIGNPKRFFTMLQGLNIQLTHTQPFVDHQAYQATLFTGFDPEQPLLMTEKDAVKCGAFAQKNWWYVPVEAEISATTKTPQKITALLDNIIHLVKDKK